jgi:hypothetical protein
MNNYAPMPLDALYRCHFDENNVLHIEAYDGADLTFHQEDQITLRAMLKDGTQATINSYLIGWMPERNWLIIHTGNQHYLFTAEAAERLRLVLDQAASTKEEEA